MFVDSGCIGTCCLEHHEKNSRFTVHLATETVRQRTQFHISHIFQAKYLVILVVYFFLQDLKSTLIPSISIIVSLVGTFACLVAAGFSLNILTLFALVLAIGTVVDDAIVVVEAVQSKFDAGYKSSYLATKDAMGDVTMAIVSCTCVFMAVFIPVTFMGGTSGVFYTQFGITMATAVGISMISALTLCPALCAIMMRPSDGTKSATSINGRGYYSKYLPACSLPCLFLPACFPAKYLRSP